MTTVQQVAASTAASMNKGRTLSSSVIKNNKDDCSPPDKWSTYRVIENTRISADSNILRVDLTSTGRTILGWDPMVPTCISVRSTDPIDSNVTLAKSYSPVSHPSTPNEFSLLVKSYQPIDGGGVGHYLCNLQRDDVFTAKVKAPRVMHGDTSILHRGWKHVGLVGGGTGVAPLYQILVLLLQSDENTKISFLNIQKTKDDILLQKELEQISAEYPERLRVTTLLTQEQGTNNDDDSVLYYGNRGTVEFVHKILPNPKDDVMILVCGKDGFVDYWGGPVGRAAPKPGQKKGAKIQGPLLGLLHNAGYDASQVFKY